MTTQATVFGIAITFAILTGLAICPPVGLLLLFYPLTLGILK